MKSYEDTKDANLREPSPEPNPEYPDEVSFDLCFLEEGKLRTANSHNAFPYFKIRVIKYEWHHEKTCLQVEASNLV